MESAEAGEQETSAVRRERRGGAAIRGWMLSWRACLIFDKGERSKARSGEGYDGQWKGRASDNWGRGVGWRREWSEGKRKGRRGRVDGARGGGGKGRWRWLRVQSGRKAALAEQEKGGGRGALVVCRKHDEARRVETRQCGATVAFCWELRMPCARGPIGMGGAASAAGGPIGLWKVLAVLRTPPHWYRRDVAIKLPLTDAASKRVWLVGEHVSNARRSHRDATTAYRALSVLRECPGNCHWYKSSCVRSRVGPGLVQDWSRVGPSLVHHWSTAHMLFLHTLYHHPPYHVLLLRCCCCMQERCFGRNARNADE